MYSLTFSLQPAAVVWIVRSRKKPDLFSQITILQYTSLTNSLAFTGCEFNEKYNELLERVISGLREACVAFKTSKAPSLLLKRCPFIDFLFYAMRPTRP